MKHTGNLGIGLLLLAWTGGTVFAFWRFEGQYLRPVPRPAQAAEAYPERLPLAPYSALLTEQGRIALTAPEPVTVLNFWNPHCPCSRYAEGDVCHLIRTYSPTGVRFVTIVAAGPSSQDGQEARQAWQERDIAGTATVVDSDNRIARRFGVWAAPAAVILTAQGRVAYVGAYNVARYCHDPHTAWGEKALAAVVEGRRPPRAKTPFFGCQLVGTSL